MSTEAAVLDKVGKTNIQVGGKWFPASDAVVRFAGARNLQGEQVTFETEEAEETKEGVRIVRLNPVKNTTYKRNTNNSYTKNSKKSPTKTVYEDRFGDYRNCIVIEGMPYRISMSPSDTSNIAKMNAMTNAVALVASNNSGAEVDTEVLVEEVTEVFNSILALTTEKVDVPLAVTPEAPSTEEFVDPDEEV